MVSFFRWSEHDLGGISAWEREPFFFVENKPEIPEIWSCFGSQKGNYTFRHPAFGAVPAGAMWRLANLPLARRLTVRMFHHVPRVPVRPGVQVMGRSPLRPGLGLRYFSVEIKIEDFGGESITEGTIMEWQKKVGDFCAKDDILVLIETDKVTIEVKAPENGVLEKIVAEVDATVEKNALLATFSPGGEPPPKTDAAPAAAPETPAAAPAAAPAATPAPAAAAAPAVAPAAAPAPKAAPKPAKPGKPGPLVEGFWMAPWRRQWYP
eukprot:symbB.v1.2.033339.t1/scaffold4129.1/size44250/1